MNTDSSKCVQKGSSPCNLCDIMEPSITPVGSYNCFPTCPDFGYYLDSNGACQQCHNACRYCKDQTDRTACYLCNSTALFVQDSSQALVSSGVAESASLMTCKCAEGTITNDQKFCRTCDSRCAVCNHPLNVDCDMCADGAYKVYKSECATRCPPHYIKDDVNHICSFDMTLLNKPEKP